MHKLKSILFKILNKILIFLSKLGISKRTPGALKLYNFLYGLFWPYRKIIEIQGSKMYINIYEETFSIRRTFEGYASHSVHEKSTTDLFRKIVRGGNIVVDLGANIGYFTLLAAKIVGLNGKVYAFEPESKNYNYLLKNIQLNNYNNVITLRKAVSDKMGKTKLYICNYDTGHHTINRYEGIRAYRPESDVNPEDFIEIDTITLDEFFIGKENLIDVIKMDIEGAEALALAGMDRILKMNRRLKMFVEFFPLLIRSMGNSPEKFIRKLLEDYHFSVYVIPDDYGVLRGDTMRINSVSEIMSLFKDERDHVNLFLKHIDGNKINFKKT